MVPKLSVLSYVNAYRGKNCDIQFNVEQIVFSESAFVEAMEEKECYIGG
jgi:hypothetical protein